MLSQSRNYHVKFTSSFFYNYEGKLHQGMKLWVIWRKTDHKEENKWKFFKKYDKLNFKIGFTIFVINCAVSFLKLYSYSFKTRSWKLMICYFMLHVIAWELIWII